MTNGQEYRNKRKEGIKILKKGIKPMRSIGYYQKELVDLCIYVHQCSWPVVFSFYVVFVWFWYQGDDGLVE